MSQLKIDEDDMYQVISKFLLQHKGIAGVLTNNDLMKNEYTWGIRSFVQKGYYAKRSGDIVFFPEPGLVEYGAKGTSHSTAYAYDTHVPLLFYGAAFTHGRTSREISITDIAPTISQLLGIQSPNGCTGKVILEVLPK